MTTVSTKARCVTRQIKLKMPIAALAVAVTSKVIRAIRVTIRGDARACTSSKIRWSLEGRLCRKAQWRMCCSRLSRSPPISGPGVRARPGEVWARVALMKLGGALWEKFKVVMVQHSVVARSDSCLAVCQHPCLRDFQLRHKQTPPQRKPG